MKKLVDEQPRAEPKHFPDRILGEGETGIGGKLGKCQYVYGRPRGEYTVYCGKPTTGLRSWCDGHLTYVASRPKLENKDEQA